MNKKGFTLVELLATITIIGIICIIIFPSVNNLIKSNEKTTAEQIGNMMISATKKYANDERLEGTGCLSVPAKKLIDFGYIETVDAGNLKCNVNNSFVRIDFSTTKKEYSYHLSCEIKNVMKTFDTNNKTVSYCDDFVPYSKTLVPRPNSQYAPDLGARGEINGANEYGLNNKGDTVLPNNSNLIPIRYYNNNWVVADVKNRSYMYPNYYWYDYNHQMWANMAIVKEDTKNNYNGEDKIGTTVNMDDILSMWVWIPRFKFTLNNKVPTVYFTKIEKDDSGNIKTGSEHTSIDDAFNKKCENGVYCIPNAFYDDDETNPKELSGFWVSKYLVDNFDYDNVEAADDKLLVKGNTTTKYYPEDYKKPLFDQIRAYGETYISGTANLNMISYDKLVSLDHFTYSKYGNYNENSSDKSSTDNIYGVSNLDQPTMTNYCFGAICIGNDYVKDITYDTTIELIQPAKIKLDNKYLYPYNKSNSYITVATLPKTFNDTGLQNTKTFKTLFGTNEEGICTGKCCYIGPDNPNNIVRNKISYYSLHVDKRYYSGIIQFKNKAYYSVMENDSIENYDYTKDEYKKYISCQYYFTDSNNLSYYKSDHPGFQDCWDTLTNIGSNKDYNEYYKDLCMVDLHKTPTATNTPSYLRLSLYFK